MTHDAPKPKWRKRPREPLDLFGVGRWKLGVALVDLGLLFGGFAALTGLDSNGTRWLGLLAFAGGVVLLALIVVYVRRPADS